MVLTNKTTIEWREGVTAQLVSAMPLAGAPRGAHPYDIGEARAGSGVPSVTAFAASPAAALCSAGASWHMNTRIEFGCGKPKCFWLGPVRGSQLISGRLWPPPAPLFSHQLQAVPFRTLRRRVQQPAGGAGRERRRVVLAARPAHARRDVVPDCL
jgi:hypothetical protein